MKGKRENSLIVLAITMLGMIALFITIAIYLSLANSNYPQGIPFNKLILPIVAIISTIGVFGLLIAKYKSVKKGEPIGDEMTNNLAMKSGNLSFITSLYVIVFIGIFSEENSLFGMELEIDTITGIVIFLMGLSYCFSYIFFKYIKK